MPVYLFVSPQRKGRCVTATKLQPIGRREQNLPPTGHVSRVIHALSGLLLLEDPAVGWLSFFNAVCVSPYSPISHLVWTRQQLQDLQDSETVSESSLRCACHYICSDYMIIYRHVKSVLLIFLLFYYYFIISLLQYFEACVKWCHPLVCKTSFLFFFQPLDNILSLSCTNIHPICSSFPTLCKSCACAGKLL